VNGARFVFAAGKQKPSAPLPEAEQSDLKAITMYPNPTHDRLNVSLPMNCTTVETNIADAVGKSVYQQEFTAKSNLINLPQLKRGIYFVTFSNGSRKVARKLVIN
jgi:hypothetical protein